MFRYIRGKLAAVGESDLVVDNHGVGYLIHVPVSLLEHLPAVGQEVTVYTYLNVREDAMQLFGFGSMDDLEVFGRLLTVSGIGPKAALAVLGTMTADDLRFAVMADDDKTIAKTPGIGAKTARKLILELKDKLDFRDVIEGALERGEQIAAVGAHAQNPAVSDAVEALVALGYPAADAMKAVRQVEHAAEMTTEELLKQALTLL